MAHTHHPLPRVLQIFKTRHNNTPPRVSFSRLFALVLCFACFTACATPPVQNNTLQRYSVVYYDVFDTVTTVIGYTHSEAEFKAQTDALYADLKAYHRLYDIYNEYEGLTNLKVVNETAANAPVVVDKKILDLLALAKEEAAQTSAQVNVAMGSVLRLWHDAREAAAQNPETAALPNAEALEHAATHTHLEDVILDFEASTVYFADPDLQLDVGSCGKGYACEMAAQAAQERGFTSAMMSVGGNLRAIGTKPDGTRWSGGIENPWAIARGEVASDYLYAVPLTDQALVISGDYQRFYEVDGKRYHHLIDPKTNLPAAYFNSVAVIAADSGRADMLSTALFCMPLEEGQALIETLPDVEALWCLPNGETAHSSGFMNHVK